MFDNFSHCEFNDDSTLLFAHAYKKKLIALESNQDIAEFSTDIKYFTFVTPTFCVATYKDWNVRFLHLTKKTDKEKKEVQKKKVKKKILKQKKK